MAEIGLKVDVRTLCLTLPFSSAAPHSQFPRGTNMIAKLDHLTIASRDRAAADRHYSVLLPLVGFAKVRDGIWKNAEGIYLQFITATEGTGPYERYGAGVNHWGLSIESPEEVEKLRASLIAAGIDAQPIQDLHGAKALFVPDPDGLRAEFTWYPDGMAPVG
ncbi:MAG: hypothetical protein WA936_07695 [Erythrobacter sp.]